MTTAELKVLQDKIAKLEEENAKLKSKANTSISLECVDGIINTPIPVYETPKTNEKGTVILGGLYGKVTLTVGESSKTVRVSCTIMLA